MAERVRVRNDRLPPAIRVLQRRLEDGTVETVSVVEVQQDIAPGDQALQNLGHGGFVFVFVNLRLGTISEGPIHVDVNLTVVRDDHGEIGSGNDDQPALFEGEFRVPIRRNVCSGLVVHSSDNQGRFARPLA